eukprot:m.460018 g.460018  ORF g.460018 m.460018 type:complete len:529 (+) comp21587_c0_seq2:251-1837(+)
MCLLDVETPPLQLYRTLLSNVHAGGNEVRVEEFPLITDSYTYKGYIALPQTATTTPAPVVLVLPNYAGLKQFDVDQITFLAQLGYVGVACDLYDNIEDYPVSLRNPGPDASKHELRAHIKGAFSIMNTLILRKKYWRYLLSSYLRAARQHPAVHPTHAAAIGYCFGGQGVLEMVRNGDELDGIVSFHGLLQSNPNPNVAKGVALVVDESVVQSVTNNYIVRTRVLIENGDLDDHVSDASIQEFRTEMNANGIDWRFNHHANAPHGFALAPGVWSSRYHEKTDRRSTLAMIALFNELWPDFPPAVVQRNACGTDLLVPVSVPQQQQMPTPTSVPVQLLADAADIVHLLHHRHESVATCESTSGGLVTAALQACAGASRVLRGALPVYTPSAARALLPRAVQQRLGAPADNYASPAAYRRSKQVFVRELCQHVRERFGSSWVIAESGATDTSAFPATLQPIRPFTAVGVQSANASVPGTCVIHDVPELPYATPYKDQRWRHMVQFAGHALAALKHAIISADTVPTPPAKL